MADTKSLGELARLVQDAFPQSEKKKRIFLILLKTSKFLTEANLAELKNLVLKCKERLSELSEIKKLEAEQKQILARMHDLGPIEVQGELGNGMKKQIDELRGRMIALGAKLGNKNEEKIFQDFFGDFSNICLNAEEEHNKRIEKGIKLEAELRELLKKLYEPHEKLASLKEESAKGAKVGAEIAKTINELNALHRRKSEIEDELERLGRR